VDVVVFGRSCARVLAVRGDRRDEHVSTYVREGRRRLLDLARHEGTEVHHRVEPPAGEGIQPPVAVPVDVGGARVAFFVAPAVEHHDIVARLERQGDERPAREAGATDRADPHH
jgi:hypothetical protein